MSKSIKIPLSLWFSKEWRKDMKEAIVWFGLIVGMLFILFLILKMILLQFTVG